MQIAQDISSSWNC